MQEKEFDKLMNNEPANWALLTDKELEQMKVQTSSKTELKEAIVKKEKMVPIKVARAITDYIERERRKGSPERRIRRAVMRKWNIKMIV